MRMRPDRPSWPCANRAPLRRQPAYRRGIQFLLDSQLEDGSWYVRTRAPPIQPHFDSDFPHGLDQFISAAATNWAAMASDHRGAVKAFPLSAAIQKSLNRLRLSMVLRTSADHRIVRLGRSRSRGIRLWPRECCDRQKRSRCS